MSIGSKMAAIADKIRSLLGLTGTMGLDAMSINLGTVQTEVESQTSLLNQALTLIEGKASGGSGGNSGPYSAAEEFIWTAPVDYTHNGAEASIPHSLGVEPDGYLITCETLTYDLSDYYAIASLAFDRSMYHDGAGIYFAMAPSFKGNLIGWAYAYYNTVSEGLTSTDIKFKLYDIAETNILPAGKRYRVLVYKR